ncbi:hypothetical protein WA026_002415 [Henosepilachna vigintioctopunctata]|uniref:Uncharacterized protein n=1 Tax=Henosepilachna vigintioctopunctata TaxID=420089 RepID=A0AAW1TUP6_9CUCU
MLLAMQIMDIYEENKIFTMKDVLIIALNRYCRSLVLSRHLSSEVFLSLYMSTHSNIASYVIGIIFGIICSRTKTSNISLRDYKFIVLLWYIISFGLPIFSLYLSFHEYSTFTNAVMGSILKPMYALGCATMIFGMMRNENLKLKKIFQWKPMVFLGNFTYSTYLFHFAPLLAKFAHSSKPIQVNGFIMAS